MKKQQKTEYSINVITAVLFQGIPHCFQQLFLWETNPISQTRQSLQPLAAQALTAIYAPNSDKKANPKQTQSKPNQTQFQKSQKPSTISPQRKYLKKTNPIQTQSGALIPCRKPYFARTENLSTRRKVSIGHQSQLIPPTQN